MFFLLNLNRAKEREVLFYPRFSFAQIMQSRKNLLSQGGDFLSGFLKKYYLDLVKMNGNFRDKVPF